jgi:hypothetical protein
VVGEAYPNIHPAEADDEDNPVVVVAELRGVFHEAVAELRGVFHEAAVELRDVFHEEVAELRGALHEEVAELHAADSHNTSNNNPSIVDSKHAEAEAVDTTEVVSGNCPLARRLSASFPCVAD